MQLSVSIATWNEAPNLPPLITELRARLAQHGVADYEIIITDGGSEDGTQEVARSLGCEVFQQMTPGFGGAVREGIDRSRGEFILTMDADLSHSPDFFDEMWKKRAEADLIVASRYVPGGSADMPASRYWLSRIINRVFSEILSIPVGDISSGYRLYRRSAVQAFRTQAENFNVMQELMTGILARGGRVAEVPFHYKPRIHGSSHARIWKFGKSYIGSLWHLFFVRATLFTGQPARHFLPYALVIVAAVLATFVNALSDGVVRWDDDYLVIDNRAVASVDAPSLARMFDPRVSREDFGSQYTPLSDLSYAVDRAAFGVSNTRFYHLQGIAWHALVAVLLFALVNRNRRSGGVAIVAALFFGLHPVTTDAVTWVSGRRTVMAAAFMLASALSWERFRSAKAGAGARAALLFLSLLLALLGGLSKQTAVAIPLLLLVLEWARCRDVEARPFPPAALGAHLVLAAALAALHVYVGRREGLAFARPLTALERMDLSLLSIGRFAELIVLPAGLRPHYALVLTPAQHLQWALLGAATLCAGLAVIFARRSMPAWRLAAGGAFATLLPALGGFGPQALAERYYYLPLAFAAVGIGAVVVRIGRAGPPPADLQVERALVMRRRVVSAGLVGVLGVLAYSTAMRNRVWHDDLTLWTDAVEKEPLDPIARGLEGKALLRANRPVEAERELVRSAELMRLDPAGSAQERAALWAAIGSVRERILLDPAGAEKALLQAVAAGGAREEWLVILGDFRAREHRIDAAREAYRMAIDNLPDAHTARAHLAALDAPGTDRSK